MKGKIILKEKSIYACAQVTSLNKLVVFVQSNSSSFTVGLVDAITVVLVTNLKQRLLVY